MKITIFTLFLLAAALLVNGCGETSSNAPAGAPAGAPASKGADADRQKNAIAKLKAENISGVEVSVTNDGVATLSGEVLDLPTKEKAGSIVKSVDGIHLVTNSLNVKNPPTPAGSLDDQIGDTAKSILKKRGLEGVTVTVKDGVVTINGKGEADKLEEAVTRIKEDTKATSVVTKVN